IYISKNIKEKLLPFILSCHWYQFLRLQEKKNIICLVKSLLLFCHHLHEDRSHSHHNLPMFVIKHDSRGFKKFSTTIVSRSFTDKIFVDFRESLFRAVEILRVIFEILQQPKENTLTLLIFRIHLEFS